MQEEWPPRPTPPGGLRPAQLGIVLVGRVILGHISATLVDLAERGFLRVDELPGAREPGWLLTDLRDQAAGGRALQRFEATLLDGLFAQQSAVRLPEISQALIPTLNRVWAQLRHDAVRHGRLRRWHRTQRTARGEQLLKQIRVFRKDVRVLASAGDPDALAGLVPYAMIFGLRAPSGDGLGFPAADRAQRRDAEVGWSRSDRFAQMWLAACGGFSHQLDRGQRHRSGTGHSSGFAQEPSHGHGHGSGHDGYGGYGHGGDFGGGHGGH